MESYCVVKYNYRNKINLVVFIKRFSMIISGRVLKKQGCF